MPRAPKALMTGIRAVLDTIDVTSIDEPRGLRYLYVSAARRSSVTVEALHHAKVGGIWQAVPLDLAIELEAPTGSYHISFKT